ncbi:TIR domain-containing protein, partial [Promicromonospora kroppenstedtii]|uniref:TIR domain-containing protein n=1 Tax=Promicromonospora kroppenstedtii TaxID=440482 RepID=UPI000560033D
MPDGGYDAFVSYSHDADGPVGPALRDALHLFARPWNRLRALRVFCDRRALDPADGLWSTIRRALDGSRFLILVASPGAAGSRWVGREVEQWRRVTPRRPVLIVRTGGQIVWDDVAGDFDWDRTTALPHALSGWFTEEPQWVDLELPPSRLSLRDPVFQDAVATLAAPLHARAKDDLLGVDVAQHRRSQGFRRAMWAGLSLVA